LPAAESPAPVQDLQVHLKQCSSCHTKKPQGTFSGFATCDNCRFKKRKKHKHWGKSQADNGQQRQRTTEDSSDRALSGAGEAFAMQQVLQLQAMLNASNSARAADQAEIQSLRALLHTRNLELAQSQLALIEETRRVYTMFMQNSAMSQNQWLPQHGTQQHVQTGTHPVYTEPPTDLSGQQMCHEAEIDGLAVGTLDEIFEQYFPSNSSGSESLVGVGNSSGMRPSVSSMQPAAADSHDSETGSHSAYYWGSLNYWVNFEDPQTEARFQEHMGHRRMRMYFAWSTVAVSLILGEATLTHLYPNELEFSVNAPNDMDELSSIQMLTYAFNGTRLVALLAVFSCFNIFGANAKANTLSRARYFGEILCHLGSISTMVSIISMHYHSTPATIEDWAIVCLKHCARTIVFAWSELHPIGAALSLIPLWFALLLVPEASFHKVSGIGVGTVFRFCIGTLGVLMGLVAFMIYRNNRQSFVNQVQTDFQRSIMTKLEQEHDSRLHTGTPPVSAHA